MDCPQCKTHNPVGAANCSTCHAPLSGDAATAVAELTPPAEISAATIVVDRPTRSDHATDVTIDGSAASSMAIPTAWSVPASGRGTGAGQTAFISIKPGSLLGNRYEILEILGEGGMGAVYKARDRELDRLVALKVIRPELAGRPEILQRFKQELILARKVTHRNVIRIFDLGEADGIKFITMEFIEGHDLKSVLARDGKLSPDRAVEIMQQVCLALEAAHTEDVVHRDLKPQNIMVDQQGRASVMDFGIARSLEFGGMTQTGALIGTPEYMSPEQVRGEHVDARSDLFALGIIFQEILTGIVPYQAETAMASMFKRTKERAVPVRQLNPAVPPYLSDIVSKCLEIEPKDRFQTAREIYDALEAWKSGAAAPIRIRTARWVRRAVRDRKAMGITAAAVVLLAGAVVLRNKVPYLHSDNSVAPGEVRSLAIVSFRNASGDASLDWLGSSLADMLNTDVGQSARLRMVSPDRVHQTLRDLRIGANAELDPDTLRRIAELCTADTVIWGQYARNGDQIHVQAHLEDLKRQHTVSLNAVAAGENDLVGTVNKLARSIRENLSLSSRALEEMAAAAFTPTSSSMEAVRNYTQGLELARQGNQIEAVRRFQAATGADPNFALAFSMLAQSYARLGYQQQAEDNASKSVDLSSNLPAVEKYMIQAVNARIGNNYQNALDAYTKLAGLMPNDAQVQFALGELYDQHGEYDNAHEHFAQALKSDPRYLDALRSMGYVEYERGNPQGSLDYLNRALSLAVQLNDQQGKATVLHDLGQSYAQLNRPQDALQNLQQSFDIEQQIGDKKGMAANLDQMAVVYASLGNSAEAEKTYQRELRLRQDLGDQDGLAMALINFGGLMRDLGRFDEALANTKQALQIELQLGNQARQATCLSDIGVIYAMMAKYDDALTYQQRAVDILQKLNLPNDLAMDLTNLGLTYTMIGQFDQALNSNLQGLEQARKTGNKAWIAAIDDNLAQLFAMEGRYGAALSAQEDSVANAQQLEQKSGTYLAESRADYASILIRLGRGQEAEKILDESLRAARSAQNDALTAKVLNFQGEAFYYQGDFKSARPFFERAQQTVAKIKDRLGSLTARFNLARLSVKDGRAASVGSTLKGLCNEAESLDVKYITIQCSMALGEAFLNTGDYAHAQSELQSAVRKSEDLGMKSLQPEAHYLLSRALRKRGQTADADRHLQQAAQLVEQMRQESRTDALLQRADLKPIVAESHR